MTSLDLHELEHRSKRCASRGGNDRHTGRLSGIVSRRPRQGPRTRPPRRPQDGFRKVFPVTNMLTKLEQFSTPSVVSVVSPKYGTDLRCRPSAEVEEPFEGGQVGSSAIPRIPCGPAACAAWRFIDSLTVSAAQTADAVNQAL